MWFQFGRWIALGIHFGSPHRVSDAPDTHLIHAAIRVGTRTWSRNPRPVITHLPIPSAVPALPVQMPPEYESGTSRPLWR
jgi:hypothetical protein